MKKAARTKLPAKRSKLCKTIGADPVGSAPFGGEMNKQVIAFGLFVLGYVLIIPVYIGTLLLGVGLVMGPIIGVPIWSGYEAMNKKIKSLIIRITR